MAAASSLSTPSVSPFIAEQTAERNLVPLESNRVRDLGIQSIRTSAQHFEQWLGGLPIGIKGDCIKQVLETLDPNRKPYQSAISILFKTSPGLKKFLRVPDEEYDENIPPLTVDSIKIITEYLIQKKSLPSDIKISFVQRNGIEANADLELAQEVKEWALSANRDLYIVHLSGSHFILFYLTQTETGVALFQLDPVGAGNPVPLEKCLETLKKLNIAVNAYVSSTKRQHSDSGCSVFVIRDIVAISKNRSILLTIAQNPLYQMKLSHVAKKIVYFTEYPPEMKKSTQSLTDLREFAKRTQNPKVHTTKSVVQSVDPEGNPKIDIVKDGPKSTDFETFITIHSKEQQNVYIKNRRIKYANLVIKIFFNKP